MYNSQKELMTVVVNLWFAIRKQKMSLVSHRRAWLILTQAMALVLRPYAPNFRRTSDTPLPTLPSISRSRE